MLKSKLLEEKLGKILFYGYIFFSSRDNFIVFQLDIFMKIELYLEVKGNENIYLLMTKPENSKLLLTNIIHESESYGSIEH